MATSYTGQQDGVPRIIDWRDVGDQVGKRIVLRGSGEEEHRVHRINKYWPLPGNYLQSGSCLVPWLGNVGRQMRARWYQIAPMRSFVVMANGRRPPTTVGKFGVGWGRNSGSRSDGRRIRLVGIDFNESWARDFCTVDQHWFRDSGVYIHTVRSGPSTRHTRQSPSDVFPCWIFIRAITLYVRKMRQVIGK